MSTPDPASKSLLDPAAQSVEPAIPADTVVRKEERRDPAPVRPGRFFALRREIPRWQSLLFAVLCIALVAALWFGVTRGESGEERIMSPQALPSPEETLDYFYPQMWIDHELTRNTLASLRRVTLGFVLAAVIGIPLGILCGCFNWFNSFMLPLTLFGRNIPIVALVPLMYTFFGATEMQKIMFIFVATVAFVIIDTATSIRDVDSRYIDTAFTLGASRGQIVRKVLVPLAMPSVFNSLRLLFGLAFGYIMLAEAIKFGSEAGGLGQIIIASQRLGIREPIYLILLIIPLVALFIDRMLYWIQRELFPHQYGGNGVLHELIRAVSHALEDLKAIIIRPKTLGAAPTSANDGKR